MKCMKCIAISCIKNELKVKKMPSYLFVLSKKDHSFLQRVKDGEGKPMSELVREGVRYLRNAYPNYIIKNSDYIIQKEQESVAK